MTDLTDKWKKGELPSGEYYIIDDLGLHTTDRYYPSHGFGTELPQSVLGRVPDYEEWKAAQEQLHKEGIWYTEISHKKVLKQNEQLKELLKECRTIFDYAKDFAYHDPCCKCIDKINQALGEDE